MTFDYTSRDYNTIRDDLTTRMVRQLPEWTTTDPADFVAMLIDLWSYMGDVLHYYVDRAAGEAFIGTATQRESVLAIANLFDYIPNGRTSSRATVNLKIGSATATDASPILIPAGTQFSASPLFEGTSKVVFVSENNVGFNTTGGGASYSYNNVVYTMYSTSASAGAPVSVIEGEPKTDTFTATTYTAQTFTLTNKGVVPSSVVVSTNEGSGGSSVVYKYVSRLLSNTGSQNIYTLETDADGYVTVVFGNGINGHVPVPNSKITVNYRKGRGTAGNVVANAISSFTNSLGLGPNLVQRNGLTIVPNSSPAIGGSDEEPLSSMKLNIPLAFRTQDRAVSLQDYKDLLLTVPGVARATAKVDVSNVVQIYAVSEQGNYGASATINMSPYLEESITNFLEPRKLVGVTDNINTTISLTTVYITLKIYVRPGYVQDTVKGTVVTAVKELFSFANTQFGGSVSIGELYRTCMDITGVDYVVVTQFTTTGSAGVIDGDGVLDAFVGVTADDDSMLVLLNAIPPVITATGGIENSYEGP